MFKIICKRYYRNLATYSWCTTWREHVSKTAPAGRWHSVGGGGAAAAAHSSTSNAFPLSCCLTKRRQPSGFLAAAWHGQQAILVQHSQLKHHWELANFDNVLEAKLYLAKNVQTDLQQLVFPQRSPKQPSDIAGAYYGTINWPLLSLPGSKQ